MDDEKYFKNFISPVRNNSVSPGWEDAKTEWEIWDYKKTTNSNTKCICGHENIKYLFTIRNKVNGKKLFPVGSCCIKKFKEPGWDEKFKAIKEEINLLYHYKHNKYIELSDVYFSPDLLKHLYNEGAFDNRQNRGKEDYEFMLKMLGTKKTLLTNSRQKLMG